MPSPRSLLPVAALLLALAPTGQAQAKAAYVDLPTALDRAEVVALVQIESVTPDELRGEHWLYRQRVVARRLEVLKGEVPEVFTIGGDRDFVCAPVPYHAPATALLLLAHDGEVLATVNNEDGQAWVYGDRIDWPYDELHGDTVPLAPVLADLRARLGPKVVATPPHAPTEPAAADAATDVAVQDVASADERPVWLVPISMLGGAIAVGLGFLAAQRRRRWAG
ncbi:MAG: hypothetical protein K1X88_07665 [Nannocystaceae bacterium]|nr:hypothetical protein [Nannocystaceae bacterium]